MTTLTDINSKDDALRQLMLLRKDRRPKAELPRELEDKVMDRIYSSSPVSRKRPVPVRLWMARVVGMAAAVAGIVYLLWPAQPAGGDNDIPQLVAMTETPMPVASESTIVEQQQPSLPVPPAPRVHRLQLVVKEVAPEAAGEGSAPAVEDVCINCEIEAMADELTAMIDRLEHL